MGSRINHDIPSRAYRFANCHLVLGGDNVNYGLVQHLTQHLAPTGLMGFMLANRHEYGD